MGGSDAHAGDLDSSGLKNISGLTCCRASRHGARDKALSYLACEGDEISHNGAFLWPCGKFSYRRRERPGDAHKKPVSS